MFAMSRVMFILILKTRRLENGGQPYKDYDLRINTV